MVFQKEVKVSFPLLGLMGLLFLTLKLTHQIDWSWLWVLAPFWVVPGVLLLIAVVALIGYCVGWLAERKGS